jgi:crotonobetainyl-CoA:carnitine CoA-transferase CaiB-like acyl-CoA transferase
VSHPKFATNPDRLANHAEFKARVEARLTTAPTADGVKRFESVSIAAEPIYEFDEVFADSQVQHLGLLTEVEQPGYGRLRMLDFPFAAFATPARIARPAPLLGQHTREVLEELGMPGVEIDRLAAAGAVQLGLAG